jgi:hypothetical protein
MVPSDTFDRTMRELMTRSDGWRESAAVWAGRVRGEVDWVVERLFLHHELCDDRGGPLSLELTEAAKFDLYRVLARDGLRPVALIHTHPKAWVGLSPVDAGNQLSSRVGFWSIVVPWYARKPWRLERFGVHVRLVDGWRHLDVDAARCRFLVEG